MYDKPYTEIPTDNQSLPVHVCSFLKTILKTKVQSFFLTLREVSELQPRIKPKAKSRSHTSNV